MLAFIWQKKIQNGRKFKQGQTPGERCRGGRQEAARSRTQQASEAHHGLLAAYCVQRQVRRFHAKSWRLAWPWRPGREGDAWRGCYGRGRTQMQMPRVPGQATIPKSRSKDRLHQSVQGALATQVPSTSFAHRAPALGSTRESGQELLLLQVAAAPRPLHRERRLPCLGSAGLVAMLGGLRGPPVVVPQDVMDMGLLPHTPSLCLRGNGSCSPPPSPAFTWHGGCLWCCSSGRPACAQWLCRMNWDCWSLS